MAITFGNKSQQATVIAGNNRVLGKPQVAPQTTTTQPMGANMKSPNVQPKAANVLTHPVLAPQVQVEVPVSVDMKGYQNPLVDLAVQGDYTVFETFPKDCKNPAGVIAYYMAYLPPNKLSNSNEPVLSVQYMFSNGDVRKRTEWFALKTDPKSNLSKFWGSHIPNWQMIQYDEQLFTTGFDIVVKDVYKNGQATKYSEISEVYINQQIDVAPVVYDIEYVPCQYQNAWGKKQPCCLAVVKGSDGEIHRYEFDDMVTIEQAEYMKQLRKQTNNEESDVHE